MQRRKITQTGNRSLSSNDENGKAKRRSVFCIVRERIPTIVMLIVFGLFLRNHLAHRRKYHSDYKEFMPPKGKQTDANNKLRKAHDNNGATGKNTGSGIIRDTVDKLTQEHKDKPNNNKRDGFMILGMHRSGTSMLTGLLYMAAGYNFGGYLYKGGENPTGFFERFDVVGQNGKWMTPQNIHWNINALGFDYEKALRQTESEEVDFKQGTRALGFFLNPDNAPWLQKDPRMCLTLKAWLKILPKEPAIVFTYRHPLEVAKSLYKRGGNLMHLARGLKLWMAYNRQAILNSKGLCIVRTRNVDVLADPIGELTRIRNELNSKCGVPLPTLRNADGVSQEEIDKFIDPTLQHHKAGKDEDNRVLKKYNDGKCLAYTFESKYKEDDPKFKEELRMYLLAMQIFCDLESGKAYEDGYKWPDHMKSWNYNSGLNAQKPPKKKKNM